MEELNRDAKTENLDAVLDFVAKKLENVDCTIEERHQIAIAVEEIFVNIAYYAYRPETGGVTVRVVAGGGGELVIEFEDSGKPYNPLEAKTPDITLGVDEREVGGLGVFMVKKLMDSVAYRRERDKNILTIRKKLSYYE
ncbi:MAG: ATP-binding protein [Chitinispirillales bacterium]|jgi:anti-sigma regulatory factor (Ser/Thr protein kinase)|nr:ATP-binding protein [Chitinispirillales bacterium]